jgi:hypothetical protein
MGFSTSTSAYPTGAGIGTEYQQAGSGAQAGYRGENLYSVFNAGEPQHVRKLCNRFGNQLNVFHEWFRRLGREYAIPYPQGDVWHGWEENRFRQLISVVSCTTNNSGGNETLVINTDANGNYYGLVGQIITIPLTLENAQIVAISAKGIPTSVERNFTIRPVTSATNGGSGTLGTNVNNAINAGFTGFAVTSMAWANETTQPAGTVVGWTERDFYLQIYKATKTWGGAQLCSKLWFEPAFGPDGKQVGLVPYDLAIQQDEISRYLSGAFLLGTVSTKDTSETSGQPGTAQLTDTFSPAGILSAGANGLPIWTTEGLIPKCISQGLSYSITNGVTSMGMQDLFNWKEYLISQGITSNSALAALGSIAAKAWDDMSKAYLQGNGTDFTKEVASFYNFLPEPDGSNQAAEMALAMGFRNIYIYDFNWMRNTIQEFSDPVGLGAPGYYLNTAGLILPMQTVRQKDGTNEQSFATRFVSEDGYDRGWEVWYTAGAGKWNKTVPDDMASMYIRVHKGLQALGMNQAIWITPTT